MHLSRASVLSGCSSAALASSAKNCCCSWIRRCRSCSNSASTVLSFLASFSFCFLARPASFAVACRSTLSFEDVAGPVAGAAPHWLLSAIVVWAVAPNLMRIWARRVTQPICCGDMRGAVDGFGALELDVAGALELDVIGALEGGLWEE